MNNRDKWKKHLETLKKEYFERLGQPSDLITSLIFNMWQHKNWTSLRMESEINKSFEGIIKLPIIITSDNTTKKRGYYFYKDLRSLKFEDNKDNYEVAGFTNYGNFIYRKK